MKSLSVLLPGINHMNGLNHNALTCSAVPIPPWERPLQTVEAQPYFNVSQASLVLEGIVFDRNNNLLFVDVATGRVFKLTWRSAPGIASCLLSLTAGPNLVER